MLKEEFQSIWRYFMRFKTFLWVYDACVDQIADLRLEAVI